MSFNRVGASGLAVSAIGLGCNNLGRPGSNTESQQASTKLIHAAIDHGITFFDVADIYGKTPGLSEEYLGQALDGRRDQVVVGTKFGMDMSGANGPDYGARGSRTYILKSVESSLRRLKTDYLDLYQYHTPDPATPIDETLHALDDLVTAGKVRYIGHSNMAGWQISQAEYVARELGTQRFISAQNHYNLMDRRAELEVLPAATEFQLGFFPYFPLNNGLLTGKYAGGVAPQGSRLSRTRQHLVTDENNQAQLTAFSAFARSRGVPEVHVAFGWLAAHPQVSSVIAGATKVEQLAQNVASLKWQPTAEDLSELEEIFPPADKIALY